uniref:Uncharacterized protein n=1 Tax=Macrostomum lignano TaxID=282301 RepID=A0A1I8FAN4_9PLAT
MQASERPPVLLPTAIC